MAQKEEKMEMKKEEKPVESKAKVAVGIKGDPKSFSESKGISKFFSGVDMEKPEIEEEVAPAFLINSLDHSMTLSYGGDAMVIPSRGKVKIANMQKMGGLPKGMKLVPIAKKK